MSRQDHIKGIKTQIMLVTAHGQASNLIHSLCAGSNDASNKKLNLHPYRAVGNELGQSGFVHDLL